MEIELSSSFQKAAEFAMAQTYLAIAIGSEQALLAIVLTQKDQVVLEEQRTLLLTLRLIDAARTQKEDEIQGLLENKSLKSWQCFLTALERHKLPVDQKRMIFNALCHSPFFGSLEVPSKQCILIGYLQSSLDISSNSELQRIADANLEIVIKAFELFSPTRYSQAQRADTCSQNSILGITIFL